MAAVVGVACEDCTGAVELFGEDEAGQFVSHCDGTKGEQKGCGFAGGLGPSVGGSDGEDDVLRALVAASAEPVGELSGGERFAAAIEQDGDCGNSGGFAGLLGLGEPGEEGGFGGEGFGLDGVVGGDAVEIEAGEGVVVGLWAGLGGFWTDMGQGELHEGPVWILKRALGRGEVSLSALLGWQPTSWTS